MNTFFIGDDADDDVACVAASPVPPPPSTSGTARYFTIPKSAAEKLSKPTPKKIENTFGSFDAFAVTLVDSQRLKNGNLYAKTTKKQASYYMHVPRDLRIITNAVKNKISHLELNIPILGRSLVFLEMKAPSSDNVLYKQLNSKNTEWIQINETYKLVKTFILVQTVD